VLRVGVGRVGGEAGVLYPFGLSGGDTPGMQHAGIPLDRVGCGVLTEGMNTNTDSRLIHIDTATLLPWYSIERRGEGFSDGAGTYFAERVAPLFWYAGVLHHYGAYRFLGNFATVAEAEAAVAEDAAVWAAEPKMVDRVR
jgi:hypothetical protein